MTAEHCPRHRANLCGCPSDRYSDPRTGAVVRVMTSRPPVPGMPAPLR